MNFTEFFKYIPIIVLSFTSIISVFILSKSKDIKIKCNIDIDISDHKNIKNKNELF